MYFTLQAMLGHSSLGMVQHYAQMMDEEGSWRLPFQVLPPFCHRR